MQLGLNYTSQDQPFYNGLFIEGHSAREWIKTLQDLQLNKSIAYIIPGHSANSVSGLLVITDTANKLNNTHKHRFVYQPYKNLYILEHTTLNMDLTSREVQLHFGDNHYFFHPEFGLIPLEKPLDWTSVFISQSERPLQIVTPKKGVTIPNKVRHFSVEIEDEDIEKNLLNQDKEPVDLNKLPFDMKKVMKGNAKELEKYMAYIEKHPEAALKLGVPLDMLGTSRGHAFAKFNFRSSFWDRFSFGNNSSSDGSGSFWGGSSSGNESSVFSLVVYIIIFVFAIALIGKTFNNSSTPKFDPNDHLNISNQDFRDAIDSLKNNLKIDSITYQKIDEELAGIKKKQQETEIAKTADEKVPENPITDFALYFIVICISGFIINLFLVEYRRYLKARKQQSNFYNIPDDSAYFDINETETPEKKLYFGGNELNNVQKLILLMIILGILTYLIYPLLRGGSTNTFFLISYTFIGLWLIYILINKHKSFDNGDEDK